MKTLASFNLAVVVQKVNQILSYLGYRICYLDPSILIYLFFFW